MKVVKNHIADSLFFAYQDEEEFMNIIHKGIADSCPQCLMLAVDRILNGIIVEEDLTKKIRNKINRYLDLFARGLRRLPSGSYPAAPCSG